MKLMRKLTWHAAKNNFVVHAQHIPGTSNSIADALSREQMQQFHILASTADLFPSPCLPAADLMLI